MQVRSEYKIAHQYKVLKRVNMRLKTVHISNRKKLFWNRVGPATIKALSHNVFDRAAGIESKILPEDLRLYKDDLNVSKSHRYLEARP